MEHFKRSIILKADKYKQISNNLLYLIPDEMFSEA